MTVNPSFEIVRIADDYLAVPVGKEADTFKGMVALNEAVAYLLMNIQSPFTRDNMVDLLTAEYEVERPVAEADVDQMVAKLTEMGLICE